MRYRTCSCTNTHVTMTIRLSSGAGAGGSPGTTAHRPQNHERAMQILCAVEYVAVEPSFRSHTGMGRSKCSPRLWNRGCGAEPEGVVQCGTGNVTILRCARACEALTEMRSRTFRQSLANLRFLRLRRRAASRRLSPPVHHLFHPRVRRTTC